MTPRSACIQFQIAKVLLMLLQMMMMLAQTPQQKIAEQSKVVKEGYGYCKFADDKIPTVMTGPCQDYSATLKNV